MDTKPGGLKTHDMGLVTRRVIRLDGYRPLGATDGTDYFIEVRVLGEQTKLFNVRGGPFAAMVDRFFELVSLLCGDARINGATEQAAHALFHQFGSELANLLRAGRRNSEADCSQLAPMGDGERSRVPEGDGTGASDASLPASVRTKRDKGIAVQKQAGYLDYSKTGNLPTNYP